MPYFYSASPLTPAKQGGGRQICLSLKDLESSCKEDVKVSTDGNEENVGANCSSRFKTSKGRDKMCSEEDLRKSYRKVDEHEQRYNDNVDVLRKKSSGSKYEAMIKEYLERKANRASNVSPMKNYDANSPRAFGDSFDGEIPPGEEQSSGSILENSELMAKRAASRQSESAILRRSQERSETARHQEIITELLSKPLERNTYVPPDRSGTPTNNRGRQRAPPRTTSTKPPINSPNKFKKSAKSRSTTNNESFDPPRAISVSIKDFNDWFANGKSWKQKIEEKINKKKELKELETKSIVHSPRLSPSVKYYAERSYIRKHSLSRGRTPSPSPRPEDDNDCLTPREDSSISKSQSMHLDELHDDKTVKFDAKSLPKESGPLYEKDVYQRLYEEGKSYNDMSKSWNLSCIGGKITSNEMTFSPRINRNSRKLMSKRTTRISSLFRSCSPSSYRTSGITLRDRQQHAQDAHKRRVRSMSPATRRHEAQESTSLRGSTLSKSYLSSSGGKLYPEAVTSSILSTGRVREALMSSRNKSLERSAVINKERKSGQYNMSDTLSDGGQIFQPRLISKESKRINSRIETSFEDRMLKSIDEFRIKQKLCRDVADTTPGPGQYNNVEDCNRCSPLRKSIRKKSEYHSTNPGQKSYSFGRSKINRS